MIVRFSLLYSYCVYGTGLVYRSKLISGIVDLVSERVAGGTVKVIRTHPQHVLQNKYVCLRSENVTI